MPEIIARTSTKDYSIRIQSGLLEQTGPILAGIVAGRRVMVVSDETIAEIYVGKLMRTLKDQGFQTFSFTMPDGDEHKSMQTLERLYQAMAIANLTQKDTVVAIGGGVVGDLAGFAAGTYLNGVKLVLIPTTLMAQVDSSVGGETFVNTSYGKNLVGHIYHPHAVLIDPLTLRTLPRERMTDGMAEVIKYGAAMDEDLFGFIEQKKVEFEWIVDRCIRLKVGSQREASGTRTELQVLDFGHTLGNVIEQLTDYNLYYHGEAVSIGMMLAARIGEALGVTPPEVVNRLRTVLQSWQLPVEGPSFSAEAIMATLRNHPRLAKERPSIILLREIGSAEQHTLSLADLEKAFVEIWN